MKKLVALMCVAVATVFLSSGGLELSAQSKKGPTAKQGTVELIERVQIDRDGFGRVLGEESVDGGAQRRFAYGFGQFIDSPLLIGDSQVGEESGEH